MKARLLVSLCAIGAAIAVASCSSGLGNNPDPTQAPPTTSQASTNLPVGLDIGLQPTDAIVDSVAAGVVVPAIGANPERDIVLLAFATASSAANGDGNGTPLSRDTVTDGNGVSDIFLAAVCAQDVDTRAFSQSLAGKFRHPRCMTCHSMQAVGTNAFVSSSTSTQTGGAQPHAGPPPGPGFPNNDPATCIPCHTNSTLFPVPGWQAPAASFDLRNNTVADLAMRAMNVPADETEHFVTDPRVLWALDSGVLPTVGGRNGAADDDHDGIDEPSDRDGVIRRVPGGSAVFIQQIEDWNASGNLVTAADAVADITLVSRAASSTTAGDGASSRPQFVWVANGGFSAPGTVGTLFIVYQSDATDLVAGDTNGQTDIFRTAVDLVSDASGNLSLTVNGNATLVSATNGTTTAGNGAATMAVAGGATANRVAFQSLATDLIAGFSDSNGAGSADIFLRNITTNDTFLISHQTGNQATGGDGASTVPSIDATGVGVAFESDATDLIASDTNGVRDVFFADVSGSAPFTKTRASVTNTGAEGTGGISADASIYVSGGGRTLVAFESDQTNLAPSLTAATNVFLFDSSTGFTTLLNQALSTSLNEIGDGSARNPVIGADGANVAFESDATNIDVLRADGNDVTDVFLVDAALALAGTVLPYRFSLTTVESTDGDGPSTEPRFNTFASTSSTFGVGFATYTTAASNLGTSDSTNLVVAFLSETSGVIPDFTFTPASGPSPLTVQFTDESTGVPTSWQWDFDNDSVIDSTEQNPSYTYTTPGTYSVKLIAANTTSSNEIIKANVIRAIGIPTPDFTATPTSGPSSLAVQFTDTSTEQPTSWSWDFGDGTALSTQQNPLHTYTTPGTYTVALTATNEAGAATETKSNFVEVFTPVVAGFSRTPSSGTVPFVVTFTNTSTGATSYVWDFGDGTATETTENPTHNYTSSGTFTVTLTATGPGGTDSTTDTVTANGVVTASFTITISAATVSSGYTTSTVTLDASGSSNATTYQWDLDNNSTIDQTGVTVTGAVGTLFPVASPNVSPFSQSYTIRLVATGPGGSAQTTQSFTAVASSSTVTIASSQDGTIYSELTTNGNGAGDQMVAGNAANTTPTAVGIRRALMEFDVAGNLPAGATVTSSSLQLECTFTAITNPIGAVSFNLHRLTSGWTEGTSSNASAGIGAAATGNDVTWAEATSGSTAWGTAGGDFNGTVSSTQTVNALGSYTWPSTATMVANVQLWLDTPSNNHGWILRGQEASPTTRTVKWFGTRENATPGNRPVLSVTFQAPL